MPHRLKSKQNSVSVYDMILYIENLKETMKKLIELVSLGRSQDIKLMCKNKLYFHILTMYNWKLK